MSKISDQIRARRQLNHLLKQVSAPFPTPVQSPEPVVLVHHDITDYTLFDLHQHDTCAHLMVLDYEDTQRSVCDMPIDIRALLEAPLRKR